MIKKTIKKNKILEKKKKKKKRGGGGKNLLLNIGLWPARGMEFSNGCHALKDDLH